MVLATSTGREPHATEADSGPLTLHRSTHHTESRIPNISLDPRRSTHGGRSRVSTSPELVAKRDFLSRERMSAGFSLDGTYSIQTLHAKRMQKRCQAALMIWMSQLRLHPFVSAIMSSPRLIILFGSVTDVRPV